MDNSVTSSLLLQKLVYDKIEFERKGFKNENELAFKIQIQIGVGGDNEYKVTLIFEGDKKDEYHFLISLTGFFGIDNKDALEDKKIADLINKNAVAILMPYLRSEVTILTAQPDTDSVVLPPFNINKIMDRKGE
ncbi:MAG: Preprotein translocase subunit SecB [Lachnospiraceae bacterium]|nr:Preprotein translocase subunit SecB [Lachnospiraceae bacterium]